MNTEEKAALPDPIAGGRYVREADGSLTCIHQTMQLARRREPPPADAPAADAAPQTPQE